MIYIRTLTGKLKEEDREKDYLFYSPSQKHDKIIKAKKITIWDNHTFYWRTRYLKKDRDEKSKEHYLWYINFILNNWSEGIIVITPDVEWNKYKEEIEKEWIKCSHIPQLYVPNTINPSNLNIVGYALRKNSTELHPTWNHCLGHIRDIDCPLLTYDSVIEREINS